MVFGLIRKKLGFAGRDAQSCRCRPSNEKLMGSPFEEINRLTGPYEHENVSLVRCKGCGRIGLYYSADIYDDFWQYWCTINEAQHAQLLEEDDPNDSKLAIRARAILETQPYLLRRPGHGFQWILSGLPVMQGPPW